MKKISVIVNCYNGEKYLSHCILSIINQNYSNLEIIIFDNCSSDQSKNIINLDLQEQEPVQQASKKIETPPLPPQPAATAVTSTVSAPINPATGLTTVETALLSPSEQAIRLKQRV